MVDKIESLVHAGMVLNDRGKWVPIAELVKKERTFLGHLTGGEVLHDGAWVKMEALRKSTVAPQPPATTIATDSVASAAEPTEMIGAPDETIGMTTEAVAALMGQDDAAPASPESDFPPETAEMKIETVGSVRVPSDTEQSQIKGRARAKQTNSKATGESTLKSNPDKDGAEFQETVMFNIQAIQSQIDEKNRRSTQG